jgi:HSP20 family molecular chaperone IbpA
VKGTEEETMSEITQKRAPERQAERPVYAPPVDIFENKDEILILADVPGVAAAGLSINLDREKLTIEAHHPEGQKGDKAFDYRRVFVVPRGLDAEKIEAKLESGVLRLTLPKPAALKPRQIQVKTD